MVPMARVTPGWVDLALFVVFAWSAWSGYRRGLVLEVLSLFRIVAGFALAVRYGTTVGVQLQSVLSLPPLLATPVAVVAIFLASQLLIAWVAWLVIRPMVRAVHGFPILGGADRLGGLALAVAQTALWLALAGAALEPLATALWPTAPMLGALHASPVAQGLVTAGQRLGPDLEPFLGTPSLDELSRSGLLGRQVAGDETIRLRFPPGLRSQPDADAEQRMLAFVNQQRSDNNLKPLTLDRSLAAAARAHSQDMVAGSYFGHIGPGGTTPLDRVQRAGARYSVVGENIAYAPNVALADSGLIRSPEHRANILRSDFTHVGIGVVGGGLFGEMFTQDFGG